MPRVVNNLKRLFRREETFLPFKQFNYLNCMPEQELNELLRFLEQRLFIESLPTLSAKRVLFISQPHTRYLLPKIYQLNPSFTMEYEPDELSNGVLANSDTSIYRDNICVVKGSLRSPALKSDFFDAIFVPLVVQSRIELDDYVTGLADTLAQGGRLILLVSHPFLEILLHNQNPSSKTRARIQLHHYMSLLKLNHLYLESLGEGVIDKETRSFFETAGKENYYDEFCGIPFALSLKAVKYVKV